MPINKFRGYYYGVGLKLDEKSINEVSNQIENKLNKAVGNVTKEITSLQEALKAGTSADFTPLVKSLGEAAGVINTVNDADFRALKDQVELMDRSFSDLSETVKQLGIDLGSVTDKFSNTMDGLSAKIDRFMQRPVEMRNSIKQDLGNMTNMVKAYAEAIKINPNMDMSGIETYFNEFKQQFSAISDLGEFATQEVANSFLKLGDVLRNAGLPFDGIRSELTQMTMQLEQAFTVKNADKAVKAFDVVGYKIDVQSEKLLQTKKRMQELEQEQTKLENMLDKSTGNAKFTGGRIASEDELLSIEEKIDKIKQYDNELEELEDGSEKAIEVLKKQISLVQNVEKELAKLSSDDKNVKEWKDYFPVYDLNENKASTKLLEQLTKDIANNVDKIKTERQTLEDESKQLSKTIAELAGQQAQVDTAIKKSNSPTAQKEQTEKTRILKLEEQVKLVADINQKEWMDTINKTINSINGATTKKGKSKIKSVKIPVEIKELEKLQEQLNKIATTSMVSDAEIKKGKNAGLDRDAVAFNKRIENLKKAIKEGKPKIKEEITAWQKEFNEAFNLEIKINGLDNDNFDTYDEKIINIVENINSKLEEHPLEFKSNITQLVESIQKELDKLEIKNIQVGGITATGASGGTLTTTPMYITQAGGTQPKIDTNVIQADQLRVNEQTSNTPVQGPEEKAWESRINKLLASWSAVSEKQKQLWDSKAKELLLVINKLSEKKDAKTLQNLLYQHPNVMNDIRRVRGSAPLQNLLDQLQADAKGANTAKINGEAQAVRSDRYVADIVEKFLKQADKRNRETGKKTKIAAELSKNQEFITGLKELQKIAAEGKGQAGQKYIDFLLKWSNAIAALDNVRPSGNAQQFLNEMGNIVTTYNEIFGGSAKNTAGIEQRKMWLQNGKEVIQYIIQLAEMAKNISPLQSLDGVRVTDKMFKGGKLNAWIRGQEVTKDDIGAIIGEKDVQESDVEKFMIQMGLTKKNLAEKINKDYAKYLTPLLTDVYDFYTKRDLFEGSLKKLKTSKSIKNPKEFVSKFENLKAGQEGEFFAENLKMFKNISGAKSTPKYLQHLFDIFKDNKIDLKSIKKSKTNEDLWQNIQSAIFNNPNVDFNKLMTDLKSGASKFGASYQSFITILEVAQKYAAAAQSLNKLGKTANEIIGGKPETVIKNGKEKTVKVGGIRQELKSRKFVLTRENGTTVGYGVGKGATDEYITGNSSSYTKIVNTLASALKDAISIAFKPMGKGQNDPNLESYKPGKNAPDSRYTVEGRQKEIQDLRVSVESQERRLKSLEENKEKNIGLRTESLKAQAEKKAQEDYLDARRKANESRVYEPFSEEEEKKFKELNQRKETVNADIVEARQKVEQVQQNLTEIETQINDSNSRIKFWEEMNKQTAEYNKNNPVPSRSELTGDNYQKLLFGEKDSDGNFVNSTTRDIVEKAKNLNQNWAITLQERQKALETVDKEIQNLEQQQRDLIKAQENIKNNKTFNDEQKKNSLSRIDEKLNNTSQAIINAQNNRKKAEESVRKAREYYTSTKDVADKLVNPYLKIQEMEDNFVDTVKIALGQRGEIMNVILEKKVREEFRKSEIPNIFNDDWYASLVEFQKSMADNVTQSLENEVARNKELSVAQQEAQARVDAAITELTSKENEQQQIRNDINNLQKNRKVIKQDVPYPSQPQPVDMEKIRQEATKAVEEQIQIDRSRLDRTKERLQLLQSDKNLIDIDGSNINEVYETIRQNVQYFTQEVEKLTSRLETQTNNLAALEKDTNATPEQKQRLSVEIAKTQQQLETQQANLKLNQDWEKQLRKEITQAGKDFKAEVDSAADSQKKNATTTTPPQSTSTAPTQTVTSMQTSSGAPVDGVQMVSGVSLTGLATEAKQNDIIAILKGGIKTTGGGQNNDGDGGERDSSPKETITLEEQARRAQAIISGVTNTTSTQISSTGEKAISTVEQVATTSTQVVEETVSQTIENETPSVPVQPEMPPSAVETEVHENTGGQPVAVQTEPEMVQGAVEGEVRESAGGQPIEVPVEPVVEDIPSIMSKGMEARIDRANKLSQAGLDVKRSRLIINDDEAFNAILSGTTYREAREKIAWNKLANQLNFQTEEDVRNFETRMLDIGKKAVFPYRKVSESSPWMHFGTDKSMDDKSLVHKKAYAAFTDVNKLTSDWFNEFLQTLINKGYKGQIKIPSDSGGFLNTDQIVGHAQDDNSWKILVDTLNEYVKKGDLTNIQTGVDASKAKPITNPALRGASFSELLEEIYGAAPKGSVFTVDEIKSIIKTAVANTTGDWGKNLFKPIVDNVISQRQQPSPQANANNQPAEIPAKPVVAPGTPQEAINESLGGQPAEIETVTTPATESTTTSQAATSQAVESVKAVGTAVNEVTKDMSVKIDSTGKQTVNTVKKIGLETAKVTTVTDGDKTSSTLQMSNKNQVAMESLFQKMQGYDNEYMFGGKFDESVATKAQDTLTKYLETYQKLDDARKQFEQSGDIEITLPDGSIKQLQGYIDELQSDLSSLEGQLLSIAKNSQSFLGGSTPFAMLNAEQIKDSANSLKLLASNTEQWAVAFNGVQNNGKRLTYDVLKDGVIKRYALEVDEATGNVRKFALSETDLVNAFQNVNKVARQGKELAPILKSDEVNQSATVVQNYQTKLKELYTYVRKAWDAARANGGLIPADEQNKIYAMSQEVQRLGAIIQSEYKKIANVIDSGAIFAPLGNTDKQMVETQMRSYLNQFAEKETMQVSNLQYDSVTRSMTADLVALDGVITKVRLDYNELLNGVQVSSAKGTVSIDKMTTEMNKLGDTINTALNAGVINKNLAEYQAYETEVAKLNKLIDDIENGTVEYNIESIQAWNAQRQAVIDTGNAIAEIAKKNAQKSLPGVRAVETQTNRRIAIDNLVESLPDAKSTAAYQKYIDAYEHLLELRDKFRSEGTLGLDANQKELQGAAEKAKTYGKELEDLIKKSIALRETAVEGGFQDVIDTNNIESQMKDFAKDAQNATQEQWKFNDVTKSASYIVKDADNVVHEMAITYDEFTQQLVKTEKQHYKVQTGLQKFFTSVGSKFKEMARYFISFGSVYQIFGMIKQGVSYVKEIDAALTELKKVTDETDVEYNKFLQSMSKTAGVVGSTVQNLTTMAAEWARLGYSMEEAGKLAESTAILLNVSEFQDATTASEALISTMQAFQYVADDSQHVVDILNEVGE